MHTSRRHGTRERTPRYVRGARKRLEKGRMWSRRRRAREQVTPHARRAIVDITQGTDGKLALTVSAAADFRLQAPRAAPRCCREPRIREPRFREKYSPKRESSFKVIVISKQTKWSAPSSPPSPLISLRNSETVKYSQDVRRSRSIFGDNHRSFKFVSS